MPLDPVARKLLDDFAASGRPNAHLLPVAEARANFEALFAGLGPGEAVASVADHEIPVAGGSIPARSYRPAGRASDARPLVVYFHGGGWLLGSVESHDGDLPLARQRVGRGRPQRRLPLRTRGALPGRRRRRAGRHALGARATPPCSAPTRAAWRSRATRPAATSRPSSARTCATRARPIVRFQLLVYPVTTADLEIGFDMAYEGYFLYRDEMLLAPGALPRLARRRAQPARLAAARRRRGPAAGVHPGRRVRPAAPAGRALSRPAAARRRARRVPPLRRHDPRLLRPRRVFAVAGEAMADAGSALRDGLSRRAADLPEADAAVDDERGAGHEARGGRGQEADDVGDVLGLAPAPERRVRPDPRVALVGLRASRSSACG